MTARQGNTFFFGMGPRPGSSLGVSMKTLLKGSRARVRSCAKGVIAGYIGQVVTLQEDMVPMSGEVSHILCPDGVICLAFYNELEPVVEVPETIAEVVKSRPKVKVVTRPCPCVATSTPGYVIGFFGHHVPCYTCRGKGIYTWSEVEIQEDFIGGSVSAVNADEECRTWPLASGDKFAVEDFIAVLCTETGVPVVLGKVSEVDGDGDPVMTVIQHREEPSEVGKRIRWYQKDCQRWNGVLP